MLYYYFCSVISCMCRFKMLTPGLTSAAPARFWSSSVFCITISGMPVFPCSFGILFSSDIVPASFRLVCLFGLIAAPELLHILGPGCHPKGVASTVVVLEMWTYCDNNDYKTTEKWGNFFWVKMRRITSDGRLNIILRSGKQKNIIKANGTTNK